MDNVKDIASTLLGLEGLVLTIVYVAGRPAEGSVVSAVAAVLLILAIAFCVVVLIGVINHAAGVDPKKWEDRARTSSSLTVYFFLAALIVMVLGILAGVL